MDSVITKIWDGTKKGLKWIAIQFLVIIAIGLLYYLGLFSYATPSLLIWGSERLLWLTLYLEESDLMIGK